MKTLIAAILLAAQAAFAQQVYISGPIYDDQFPGGYVIIIGEQFTNNSCSVIAFDSMTSDPYVMTSWPCNPNADRFVAATWPMRLLNQSFFESVNTPCGAQLSPGRLELLNAADEPTVVVPTTPSQRQFRITLKGTTYQLGMLPEPLVPKFDGVRHFCLIPAPPLP